jgi:hypothetical protein
LAAARDDDAGDDQASLRHPLTVGYSTYYVMASPPLMHPIVSARIGGYEEAVGAPLFRAAT